MGRLLAIALAVAAVLIAVVAVNGPGKDRPEAQARISARQSSHVAAPTGSSPASGGKERTRRHVAATVRMKDLRFRPGAVTARVGQVVRFVNDDDVAHTVLEDFGPRSGEIAAVDSGRILPGQSFEFVPRANGLIPYVCTLHPSVMVGQILVEKPAT
jgi:plastocyanin